MSSATGYNFGSLQPYQSPEWARNLKCQPTAFVQLAMRPTPIHRWALPGVPSDFQVYVKRDDLTGSTLSGNKIRKLEFLLADALQKGCDSVVTLGGMQSNHARTTAVAARRVGLDSHVLLLSEEGVTPSDVQCNGNLLLDRLAGARIVLVKRQDFIGVKDGVQVTKTMTDLIEDYAEKLRRKGAKPYTIPAGGYCAIGEFGYIEAFKEMMEQGLLDNFDDVVLSSSGGGTGGALAVANYLTGSKVKIHAVSTYSDAIMEKVVEEVLREFGLTEHADGRPMKPGDILDVISISEQEEVISGKPVGEKRTSEELATIIDLATTTAILTDPVFTVKGVMGMLAALRHHPHRFSGKRILFLHTGGLFTLYDGRIDELLKQTPATNQVATFGDVV